MPIHYSFCLGRQRRWASPLSETQEPQSILMSKGNAMHYSGVNHQGVKTKVGSASELK